MDPCGSRKLDYFLVDPPGLSAAPLSLEALRCVRQSDLDAVLGRDLLCQHREVVHCCLVERVALQGGVKGGGCPIRKAGLGQRIAEGEPAVCVGRIDLRPAS